MTEAENIAQRVIDCLVEINPYLQEDGGNAKQSSLDTKKKHK